ncbi:hypothetical protein GCM10010279_00340 [Streptomyces mutabilis]|nr:hypothetical protein GCM10010279_00340 [Streptomyces mutabilis]
MVVDAPSRCRRDRARDRLVSGAWHREGMEIDGDLAIKVETENWQTHARIPATRLRELVARIGGAGDRLLIVQRIPDVPDEFAQVWHENGGDYRLEYRAAENLFFGTDLYERDRVADLLTGWARQEPGWERRWSGTWCSSRPTGSRPSRHRASPARPPRAPGTAWTAPTSRSATTRSYGSTRPAAPQPWPDVNWN